MLFQLLCCAPKTTEWLSSLVSNQEWKSCARAVRQLLLSFHSVVSLADGRRVKADLKKVNLRPLGVCKQALLVSLEIS